MGKVKVGKASGADKVREVGKAMMEGSWELVAGNLELVAGRWALMERTGWGWADNWEWKAGNWNCKAEQCWKRIQDRRERMDRCDKCFPRP